MSVGKYIKMLGDIIERYISARSTLAYDFSHKIACDIWFCSDIHSFNFLLGLYSNPVGFHVIFTIMQQWEKGYFIGKWNTL